jgi:hypothetical protein
MPRIVGACDHSDRAGYDSSGNLIIKAFKGPGGYNCILLIERSRRRADSCCSISLAVMAMR